MERRMRVSTKRTLLRAATAVAVVCTAAVMFLPTTVAGTSTSARVVSGMMCDVAVTLDCPETAISLSHAR
jgi:hypothetical protein